MVGTLLAARRVLTTNRLGLGLLDSNLFPRQFPCYILLFGSLKCSVLYLIVT